MKRYLLTLAVLAGCGAAVSAPVPQAVSLSTRDLTLDLSGGQRCRVTNWPAAPTGSFSPCVDGFGYSVEVIENPNVLRQIWADVARALGADEALAPLARVVITDPVGGRHVFASPPPDEG